MFQGLMDLKGVPELFFRLWWVPGGVMDIPTIFKGFQGSSRMIPARFMGFHERYRADIPDITRNSEKP